MRKRKNENLYFKSNFELYFFRFCVLKENVNHSYVRSFSFLQNIFIHQCPLNVCSDREVADEGREEVLGCQTFLDRTNQDEQVVDAKVCFFMTAQILDTHCIGKIAPKVHRIV